MLLQVDKHQVKTQHTLRCLSRRSAAEPAPSCCGASGAPSSCPFPASGRITLQRQLWISLPPRMLDGMVQMSGTKGSRRTLHSNCAYNAVMR